MVIGVGQSGNLARVRWADEQGPIAVEAVHGLAFYSGLRTEDYWLTRKDCLQAQGHLFKATFFTQVDDR